MNRRGPCFHFERMVQDAEDLLHSARTRLGLVIGVALDHHALDLVNLVLAPEGSVGFQPACFTIFMQTIWHSTVMSSAGR